MVQNLNCLYQEIRNDSKRWLYYHSDGKDYARWFPKAEDCIGSPEKAHEFIVQYFKLGGKMRLFQDINEAYEEVPEGLCVRLQHIVSTFFLGIKIAESFGVNTTEKDEHKFNFLYYWFLACLYHDIGYSHENSAERDKLLMIAGRGFNALKGLFDIKHFCRRTCATYGNDIVELYLKERAKEGKIDHGILGGLLLYDRLRKQLKMAFAKREFLIRRRKEFELVVYLDSGDTIRLLFAIDDYKAYAKAADAVIAHNIWLNTLERYMAASGDYNDENSVKEVTRKKHIIFEEDMPAGFILALADTIEPIKYDIPPECIEIEALGGNRKGIQLKINMACSGEKRKPRMKLVNNILALEDWVKVKVDADITFGKGKNGNGIIIKIYNDNSMEQSKGGDIFLNMDNDKAVGKSVKKWLAKDYYTPKFKAEVVFDTLLSDSIEELLEETLCPGNKVTLLAKEFPISNFRANRVKPNPENADNNRGNSAVDYLACANDKEKIFFVELKTSDGSFKERQLEKYLRFCGNKVEDLPGGYEDDFFAQPKDLKEKALDDRKLFTFYKKVCRDIDLDICSNAQKSGKAFNLEKSEKYVFQLAEAYHAVWPDKNFCDAVAKKEWDEPQGSEGSATSVEKIIAGMENSFNKYKICLVYVSMTDIANNIDDEINKLELAEEDKERIRGNIYNIVLTKNQNSPKAVSAEDRVTDRYVTVCNGYDSLVGYMRDIVDKILEYKIE